MRNSNLLTEFNDISQRLEYLVAHSSQMVFVTGEDMAIQQGFVEAFLGQQSTTASVAYLSARRGKPGQFYRQQFCQQFDIPQSKQNIPLVQSFATRSDKGLPVIIAITGAENLPEEILRELWDLVLQNRFARNVEQINILLFGDQDWAEEVKSWLPTNNNDKPVLLTTQTLEYDEEHEVEGDLDALIANRRKKFQDRLKARSDEYNDHVSPFSKWWFKLLVASVFLLSFGSILLTQYFDVSKSSFTEFTQFLLQINSGEESQSETSLTSDASDQTTNRDVLAAIATTENLPAENPTVDDELQADSLAIEQNNQRVADNFESALSNLDSSRTATQPEADSNNEQPEEVISVRIQTVDGQNAQIYESEFIVDITPEQLKQLKEMTAKGQTGFQAINEPLPVSNLENQLAQTERDMQAELRPSQREELEVSNAVAQALREMAQMEQELVQEQEFETPELGLAPAKQPALQSLVNSALEIAESLSDPIVENLISSDAAQPAANETLASPQGTVNEYSPGVAEFVPIEEGSLVTENQLEEPVPALPAEQSQATLTLGNEGEVADYAIEDSVPAGEFLIIDEQATFNFDEALLLQQPQDNFVLQITGISTLSLLNEYLRDYNLLNTVWVYQTQRYGGDWFVVLLNQSYSNIDEARAATSIIQQTVPGAQAFAKSIAQVRSELGQ